MAPVPISSVLDEDRERNRSRQQMLRDFARRESTGSPSQLGARLL